MITFRKHIKLLKLLEAVLNERREEREHCEDINDKAQEFINLMYEQANKDRAFKKDLLKWLTGEKSTTFLRDNILIDGLGLDMKHCNSNLLNRNAFYTLDTVVTYTRQIKL